ncbi:MAG: glycosyltransferase, partial [Phycisphaerales bacterium]
PFSHARIAFSVDGAASVLDLRDPWALDGWMVHRHWLAFRRELAQMRRALAHADGVVANVPGARTAFERLAPREGRTPYAVVTNGWEELDFPKVEPVPRRDRLVMRMSGTFLSSDFARLTPMRRIVRCLRTSGEHIDGRGRSPYFLLRALRALRNAGHPAGSEIVLEVAGQADALTLSLIEESGMGDAVRMLGYLPHSESVSFIREADALVLPMHGLPRGDRARMVPGKLYEYLATGRPILGLVPNGDARDWIAEHPHSAIAEPCDERAVVDALTKLHDAWLAGRTVPSVRSARTGEFTRRKQAAKLAEYLRRVLADRGR